MGENKRKKGEPIESKQIFKIMIYLTYIVSSVYLLKNIIGKSLIGGVTIGVSLLFFSGILFYMKKKEMKEEVQQFVVSICLVFLVFIISLNSGDFYSDDFPLYLAVMGLTGLYLRPNYTKTQTMLITVLLVIQYFVHPEKADSMSQFFLCTATFVLAGWLFCLTIKRGHAFILKSYERAEAAEELLKSMSIMGDELEQNFVKSSKRIEKLQDADVRLSDNARELEVSSKNIASVAREVEDTCDSVQSRIQVTGEQINTLNGGVKTVETALADNTRNMEEVSRQMDKLKHTMQETNAVFQILEERMDEISKVTEQLNSISNSTTMLSLNASIEAARAGQAGAGFAVVASKVKDLAVDSSKCSVRVVEVIHAMHEQIQMTTDQFGESEKAIDVSIVALDELKNGFERLTKQFDSLYGNIEEQNENVNKVESIFRELKDRIGNMSSYTEKNQISVDAISEAMGVYKENMSEVIDDSRHIHELSESMLGLSKNK